MLTNVVRHRKYRNIENGLTYLVEAFVLHSETMEMLVLYQCLDTPSTLWVRPTELFKEKFEEIEDE